MEILLPITFVIISLASLSGTIYVFYKHRENNFLSEPPEDNPNKFEELEDIITKIEKLDIYHRKLY